LYARNKCSTNESIVESVLIKVMCKELNGDPIGCSGKRIARTKTYYFHMCLGITISELQDFDIFRTRLNMCKVWNMRGVSRNVYKMLSLV